MSYEGVNTFSEGSLWNYKCVLMGVMGLEVIMKF